MSTTPLCSVVLAVYNDESHICRSVLSVLNQTLRDIELLVVDDCSTDETPRILNRLAASDGRLRVVRNPSRRERSWSRNEAIRLETQTPYIAIMDSDDICLPTRLERQLSYMEAHLQTVALGGQVYFLSPDEELFAAPYLPVGTAAARQYLRRKNPLAHPTLMIRKTGFEQAGMYDERLVFSEDYDLCWRLSQIGELDNLEEVILLYNRDWRKEQRMHFRRRLNHLRVRLRWLMAAGMRPADLGWALTYLLSAISPPVLVQRFRRHRYSSAVPADSARDVYDWMQQLKDQEAHLRQHI